MIVGYANYINVEKLGFLRYHVLITPRCRAPEQRKILLKYLYAHPQIVATSVNVGEWEYESEFITEDPEEVLRLESELVELLPHHSVTMRWLQVAKVHKLQPLPSAVPRPELAHETINDHQKWS